MRHALCRTRTAAATRTPGSTWTINLREGENVTCTFTNTHTSNETELNTTPSADTGTIGDVLTDQATLSGATAGAGGTIDFFLFAPERLLRQRDSRLQLDRRAGRRQWLLQQRQRHRVGQQHGHPVGHLPLGRQLLGDADNVANSACAAEPVVISPNAPELNTTPSADTGAIGDVLTDQATLSRGHRRCRRHDRLLLFAPGDDCSDNATAVYSSTGVPVDGNENSYSSANGTESGSNTATQSGTYHWAANYSGDANNDAANSACAAEPVVISPNAPELNTTPSADTGAIGDVLTDQATLSGATAGAGGTIDFFLFAPGDDCSDNATAVYSSTGVPVDGNGSYSGANGTESGNNTATQSGTYHWAANYSGDANNDAANSACAAEPVVIS